MSTTSFRRDSSPSPYAFPVSTDNNDWWDEEFTGDPFYGDQHRRSKSAERAANPNFWNKFAPRRTDRAISLEPDWAMSLDWCAPTPFVSELDNKPGPSTLASSLHTSEIIRGRKRRRSLEDEEEIENMLRPRPKHDDLKENMRTRMTASYKRQMTEVEYLEYQAELAEEERLGRARWEAKYGRGEESPVASDSTLFNPYHPDVVDYVDEHAAARGASTPAGPGLDAHHMINLEHGVHTANSDVDDEDDRESDTDLNDRRSISAERASPARSISPPFKSSQPTRRRKPRKPAAISAVPVNAWYIMMADPNGRAYPWVVSQELWNQVAVVIQDGRQELWHGSVVPWVQPVGPRPEVKEEPSD